MVRVRAQVSAALRPAGPAPRIRMSKIGGRGRGILLLLLFLFERVDWLREMCVVLRVCKDEFCSSDILHTDFIY